jgi:NADPH:quinone reductase-like Zn-dependent oxidoreductase
MTLGKRILSAVFVLAALAAVSFAYLLSRNAPCVEPEPFTGDGERMQAIVYSCYGTADVLRLAELARPVPAENEVLVKVHAASVNPLDWHYMSGTPYVMRMSSGLGAPQDNRMGVDFAGTVDAVGRDVTRFKPGDQVFGGRNGAFAEYVTVRQDRSLALKPPMLSFEEAAAIPVAAITALQGLRDAGRIVPGDKVLINGASGGVGTFAVQIAKAFGAHVTGVSSSRNLELVRSIGADHVIDYTQENFTAGVERYDLILDNVGNHSLRATRRVLAPGGVLVIVSGPKHNLWLGPMTRVIGAKLSAPFVDEEMATLFAALNAQDLEVLAGLARDGKLKPVIDRRYTLEELPEAVRYLATGRARGKVVVKLD